MQRVLEIAERVREGRTSAREVALSALAQIEAQRALGAYVSVARDDVLAQADAVDATVAAGDDPGALAGVPIGIKDALCTRGQATTAGSKILTRGIEDGAAIEPYLPPYDATAVSKLRAAGAVLVGKCNMDEFAMGSSNENSAYGPARNPHDTTRTPGGSSGGSAVSVAAGMTPAALGSDTGGSVRQPASLCGVVGIKPSYGRVSRYGLIAFASSLDQIGPLASDVRGAAAILKTIAGDDPADATSVERDVGDLVASCDAGVAGDDRRRARRVLRPRARRRGGSGGARRHRCDRNGRRERRAHRAAAHRRCRGELLHRGDGRVLVELGAL